MDNPLIDNRRAARFYGKQKGIIGKIADDLKNGMISFANKDSPFYFVGMSMNDTICTAC